MWCYSRPGLWFCSFYLTATDIFGPKYLVKIVLKMIFDDNIGSILCSNIIIVTINDGNSRKRRKICERHMV